MLWLCCFSVVSGQGAGLSHRPDATVYDANLNVTWLEDANFAASATGKSILAAQGVTGVDPSGLMDYPTAVKFVQAMNSYQQMGSARLGYLGHSDWQLPATPAEDPTCTVHKGFDGNSFGPTCRQSDLGCLFYVGLGLTYPSSVAPAFKNALGAVQNLHPSPYWSSSSGGGAGIQTFSFLTGMSGANTPRFNLLHLIALYRGVLPGSTPEPAASKTAGVVAYVAGPAAGKVVYDNIADASWLLDANLPATEPFSIHGTLSVAATKNFKAITLPLLAPGGALHDSAAQRWVADLSAAGFGGGRAWILPALSDLERLYQDLKLAPGNPALVNTGTCGPFKNFQPFFYWACHTGQTPGHCDYEHYTNIRSGIKMRWSFNFDTGFQGTSQETKKFFVLLYHPGSRD